MTAQPRLDFDDGGLGPAYPGGAPARRESETSREAAAAVTPQLRDRQIEVLRELLQGTGTVHELVSRIERIKDSVGPRLSELRQLGLIEDSGERRPSPSGRPSTVWRLTERGLRVVRGIR